MWASVIADRGDLRVNQSYLTNKLKWSAFILQSILYIWKSGLEKVYTKTVTNYKRVKKYTYVYVPIYFF